MRDVLEVVKEVLDHQLLDRDGRRCGNVDDLELEGAPGRPLRVAAVISGPGAWRARTPRGLLLLVWPLERLFGRGTTRIDWERVSDVGAAVELDVVAREVGLGAGDDRAERWVRRLPGA